MNWIPSGFCTSAFRWENSQGLRLPFSVAHSGQLICVTNDPLCSASHLPSSFSWHPNCERRYCMIISTPFSQGGKRSRSPPAKGHQLPSPGARCNPGESGQQSPVQTGFLPRPAGTFPLIGALVRPEHSSEGPVTLHHLLPGSGAPLPGGRDSEGKGQGAGGGGGKGGARASRSRDIPPAPAW